MTAILHLLDSPNFSPCNFVFFGRIRKTYERYHQDITNIQQPVTSSEVEDLPACFQDFWKYCCRSYDDLVLGQCDYSFFMTFTIEIF